MAVREEVDSTGMRPKVGQVNEEKTVADNLLLWYSTELRVRHLF